MNAVVFFFSVGFEMKAVYSGAGARHEYARGEMQQRPEYCKVILRLYFMCLCDGGLGNGRLLAGQPIVVALTVAVSMYCVPGHLILMSFHF